MEVGTVYKNINFEILIILNQYLCRSLLRESVRRINDFILWARTFHRVVAGLPNFVLLVTMNLKPIQHIQRIVTSPVDPFL